MIQLVHDSKSAVRRDRFIRLAEVTSLTGMSKSTVYTLMGKGEFPQPVRLGARMVAWPESMVLQWIQDVISQSQHPSAARVAEVTK